MWKCFWGSGHSPYDARRHQSQTYTIDRTIDRRGPRFSCCTPDRCTCQSVRASPPWTTCSPRRGCSSGGTNVFDKVAGGVVNSAIALAAARGIQKAMGSGQLNEFGRGWSKSFMERNGFVMRKAMKTAKKLSSNVEELKESYDIFGGGGEQHSS